MIKVCHVAYFTFSVTNCLKFLFLNIFVWMIKTERVSRDQNTSFHCLSPLFFSDTICDLGGVDELANYGEYSGAPSEQQTYDYAKTILSLMTREKHPEGEKRLDFITACLKGKSKMLDKVMATGWDRKTTWTDLE